MLKYLRLIHNSKGIEIWRVDYGTKTNTDKGLVFWFSDRVLTFSAVLGPLFLLPFGRPLGRFGVGGPTGSCKERPNMDSRPLL